MGREILKSVGALAIPLFLVVGIVSAMDLLYRESFAEVYGIKLAVWPSMVSQTERSRVQPVVAEKLSWLSQQIDIDKERAQVPCGSIECMRDVVNVYGSDVRKLENAILLAKHYSFPVFVIAPSTE